MPRKKKESKLGSDNPEQTAGRRAFDSSASQVGQCALQNPHARQRGALTRDIKRLSLGFIAANTHFLGSGSTLLHLKKVKPRRMIKRVNSSVKRQFSSAETTQDEERMKVGGLGEGGRGEEEKPDIFHWLTKLHILWAHCSTHGPSMIFETTRQVEADGGPGRLH